MKKEKIYKKGNNKKILIVFVVFLFVFILSHKVFADPLIIDHTVVDQCDDIPQYWIDEVKKMWATVPGESHSRGYRIGLHLLDSLESRFDVNIQESGIPEGPTDQYLRFSAVTWGDVSHETGWRYGYGEEDWYTSYTAISHTKAGITYCNTTGPLLYAMGLGWCWDMTWHNDVGGIEDPVYRTRWAGSSVGGPDEDMRWGLDAEDSTLTENRICMDTYLQATQEYIDHCTLNGYITKIFFTTGPIDGSSGERAYQRYLKHEHIRNHVSTSSNGVLFDYADILSWSNAGLENTQSWTDYGGTPHTFQYIHPDNMLDLNGTYVEDGDHIGQRGAIRLGKAMWYMLARIAGWDGDTSGIIESSNTSAQFCLYQNLPNPFNLSTEIQYFMPYEEYIKLTIYDKNGCKIRTLVSGVVPKGLQSVNWDGLNDKMEKVGSGVYFYKMKTVSGFTNTLKMTLLK